MNGAGEMEAMKAVNYLTERNSSYFVEWLPSSIEVRASEVNGK